jgi:hypothetical protein
MAGHLLGGLKPSVVLQVNRDAGCPPTALYRHPEQTSATQTIEKHKRPRFSEERSHSAEFVVKV